MPERGSQESKLDVQIDRVMEEMGLCPDTPPTSLTLSVGFEFATRLFSSILVTPTLVESIAHDVLDIYREMFPPSPDPDTREAQTYFWAPWVAMWLTGRGLTIPQIARLASVDSDHVYRRMRKGLRILFVESEPPARTGVNRRYSRIDGRETYLVPDPKGLTERPWPADVEEYRPFIEGVLAGVQAWLSDPENKARLEPTFMEVFASVLTDPYLREVFDGAVEATQRISLDLRDQILSMVVERDRATNLARTMAELANHKELVFETLTQAAGRLTSGTAARPGVN